MDLTHNAVTIILRGEKRGIVLDAGAGEGTLSKLLKQAGFNVVACDINPEQFKIGRCKKVDLNQDLPYPNNSFDYITCVEVIEHLENPHHLIREFSRTIKKNGLLIITTPNIMNIFSRLKFLLRGEFFCFSKRERNSGHLNPVPYWELKEILKKNDFKLIRIETNRKFGICGTENINTKIKRFVTILCYGILYLILRPKNKIILEGDILIFVAKKV